MASGGAPASGAPPAAPANGSAEQGAELARMEDRYKRALADLDNYRKRSARDVQARVDQTRESLLRDWLEAVDSVERALQMSHGTPAADGLRALLEQMEAILARQGAHRIGAAGEPFDPERHEAIEARPSADVPDRTVLEAVRSGWALGDRVVRPALVVVARRPDPAAG
ncbi:MAG: molecular chaperone GrpE [Solirubrobacteraceae bacterium]|jgi:molecular chaperone GrpE|nr:molecular chaperone GrpE [Solirubrobacteraceae bacterium]MEA2187958.1 molecular chaperone GrpE [Solirubrobacteraceae bacterium]